MEKGNYSLKQSDFVNLFTKYFNGLDLKQKHTILGTSKKLNENDFLFTFKV